MEQQTIIFMGSQGSGKGTQVELLQKYLQKTDTTRPTLHIETGKAFRAFADEDNYTSSLIREDLIKGKVQPLFLAIWLWTDQFVKQCTGNENILIDGFPRTREQALALHAALHLYKRHTPKVIYLQLDHETAAARLLARGREDDTPAAIARRLAWHEAQVVPIIEYYREEPFYDFLDIDANKSVEEVHQSVLRALAYA